MERKVTIQIAKDLFRENFVGPEELAGISNILPLEIPSKVPDIPFSYEVLNEKCKDYLLILFVDSFTNGHPVNILKLREIFGINPDEKEPCFYNQDWYVKEDFVQTKQEMRWILLRKYAFEDSRAVDPKKIEKNHPLPTALTCIYSFFVYKLITETSLWQYDFIWCIDRDHNGDRIYVGKYFDIDGVNKNGFSIHRHLSLRDCYAAIEVY